jgi:hypothetical protein
MGDFDCASSTTRRHASSNERGETMILVAVEGGGIDDEGTLAPDPPACAVCAGFDLSSPDVALTIPGPATDT